MELILLGYTFSCKVVRPVADSVDILYHVYDDMTGYLIYN